LAEQVSVNPVAIMQLALLTSTAFAGEQVHNFGVLNQRNSVVIAQYWNSILDYVSHKSRVALQLKMGKTVQETERLTVKEEFDFVFSDHIFILRISKARYQVIARPVGSFWTLRSAPGWAAPKRCEN
jgi:phosphonate transport system substrate-binding protein